MSVFELLPHDVEFDHPVNLKFKVPSEAEFAVLYVQKENKTDKILDVYQAIPNVCQNGEISVERKSFSYMFVDTSKSIFLEMREK